ncbi:alpha/beta hydrolase [Streptoalloteichus hindustanus]|uniref:Alpha/beta hydrolase fold n=1 Tax=Streptoalloteichus hindustanus TaxID=2017 RepID=A0A1M5D7Z9_STRHI|nr:alpha/beta hydrolase [Streptoalloteichus hindustanus]SHF63017.1 alpha/beta hydrolase fold [Streptoalloteichus hindustanus]
MRRRHTCLRVLGAAVIAFSALVAPPAHAQTPPPAEPRWQDCPETTGMQCASIAVPVDWRHPDGETLTLALGRRPATDPARRRGVLIVNPGGPGDSGVGWVRDELPFTSTLRERFDIVGIDTRDTHLRCDQGLRIQRDNLPLLPGATDHQHRVAVNQALARSCRHFSGALYDHVSSADLARDMDHVRAALGEARLNYYGISYGTLVGQTYAELFPSRIRAMVLDSVVDHSLDPRAYVTSSAWGLEDAFAAFARWCRTAQTCDLSDRDPQRHLGELWHAAARGRLRDSRDQPVSPDALSASVDGALRSGELRWHDLGASLADLRVAPDTASAADPATSAQPHQPDRQTTPTDIPDVEHRPTPLLCADWRFDAADPARLDQYWELSVRAAPHTRVNRWSWEWITRCAGWPDATTNPPHRLRVPHLAPVLVANARHDVATPHPWARSVAEQLPGSTLLTYDGARHEVYLPASPCMTGAIDRYLVDRLSPAPDTHCPAVEQPA